MSDINDIIEVTRLYLQMGRYDMKGMIKRIMLKLVKLFLGYFILAYGIVMTVNANLGLGAWEVFHQGISNVLGITMGQASILVGAVIILFDFVLKEKVGWGTVFNMMFIGIFMDILMINKLVPAFEGILPRVLMIILGLFIVGFGTYLYIDVELGSGPRDGLMIALAKKTKKPVGFIKNAQEITAVAVGFLLGGKVGIGTVMMSILGGWLMQLVFKLVRFDINEINHRFIDDDIRFIKGKIADRKV